MPQASDLTTLFPRSWKGVSGVYAIRHVESGKVYVGSSRDVRRRLFAHLYALRETSHCSPHLQAAWTKYGEKEFEFCLVERVEDLSSLVAREQAWIDSTRCCEKSSGYNVRRVAESNLGMKTSPEVSLKLSVALKGKPWSEARRRAEALVIRKPMSEEEREERSRVMKARRNSPEFIALLNAPAVVAARNAALIRATMARTRHAASV